MAAVDIVPRDYSDHSIVMAGLVPAIHVLLFGTKDVDAGHDGGEFSGVLV